jgi:gliding motility-associated lipoprotein GldD
LSYEHSVKADNILEQPFVNIESKVYGSLFEVQGNAASQTQFFVTDSTTHFLTGSVYFYTKPNYDSILPAAAYLQNDIRNIMETLRWKE